MFRPAQRVRVVRANVAGTYKEHPQLPIGAIVTIRNMGKTKVSIVGIKHAAFSPRRFEAVEE